MGVFLLLCWVLAVAYLCLIFGDFVFLLWVLLIDLLFVCYVCSFGILCLLIWL